MAAKSSGESAAMRGHLPTDSPTMAPGAPADFTTRNIVVGFLNGCSLPHLTATHRMPAGQIYVHLQKSVQQHSRSDGCRVQIPSTDLTEPGQHDSQPHPVSAFFAQLMDEIRQKDQQLMACSTILTETRQHNSDLRDRNLELTRQRDQFGENLSTIIMNLEDRISAKSNEIRGLHDALNTCLEERRRCNEAMTKLRQSNENMETTISARTNEIIALREEIATLRKAKKEQKKTISARTDEIVALHEALEERQASDPNSNRPRSTTDRALVAGDPMLGGLSEAERPALQMFYEGQDLSTVSSVSHIAQPDLFAVLHRLFCLPDCRLLQAISLPADWQLDHNALVRIARSSSFLLSMRVYDHLFCCGSCQELVTRLATAFEEFAQFSGR
jgi:hypothetical protein